MEPFAGEQPLPSVDQPTTPRVPLSYVPRQRPAILEMDMGDGVVLYDDASSLVHHLSPSASIVWQLCQGEASVGELAADIAYAYRMEGSEVESQLTAVIAEFDAMGMVEDVRSGTRS